MKRQYRPNDDEAAVAALVARRRNSLNGGGTNLPGGETETEEGRFLQHYRACLAEIAVSRITNLCWTGCGKGSAGLHDVGDKYEVRSIADRGRGLLARGKDKDHDPAILVYVGHDRACEIIGWEFFGEVKRRGRALDEDSPSPCWIVPSSALRDWADLAFA